MSGGCFNQILGNWKILNKARVAEFLLVLVLKPEATGCLYNSTFLDQITRDKQVWLNNRSYILLFCSRRPVEDQSYIYPIYYAQRPYLEYVLYMTTCNFKTSKTFQIHLLQRYKWRQKSGKLNKCQLHGSLSYQVQILTPMRQQHRSDIVLNIYPTWDTRPIPFI